MKPTNRNSPLPPPPPMETGQRQDTRRSEDHRRPSTSGASTSSEASSVASTLTTLNVSKRPLYSLNQAAAGSNAGSNNSSNTSLSGLRPQNEPVPRRASPLAMSDSRFRARHHSQGFFEPSLPTTSSAVSASRIAAQAAMQHAPLPQQQQQQQQQHLRNRSQTIPPPDTARGSPPPMPASGVPRAVTATTAANIAFPRLPAPQSAMNTTTTITGGDGQGQAGKGKSKMKLFSKPRHKDKEDKGKDKTPSPSKLTITGSHGLARMVNASTSSLVDGNSNNNSMYSLANSSATTVVPIERASMDEDKKDRGEKEKHKHHFLSRQKLKLKDADFHLPLSSASSNSRPLDPSAPSSLYSFAPPSPSVSTFGKSMSGLDLRHGGRALREKKKEEKAQQQQQQQQQDAMQNEADVYSGSASIAPSTTSTTTTAASNANAGSSSLGSTGILASTTNLEALQGFGLQNMTPDDAWDFLKAKLLVLFEGEDVRIAIEDLNKLVKVHITYCVQKHSPTEVIEDLRDLLATGFASVNYSLHKVPEENIIPHLVKVWVFAFGTILPFMMGTFFPLDLEFKGHGSIMSAREAREFWGATPGTSGGETSIGSELDVRRIVLTSFRDCVILTRYEVLKAAFSRLSLERMNAGLSPGLSAGGLSAQGKGVDDVTETAGRMLQCVCVLASVQSDDEAQKKIEDLSKALKHNWLGRGRAGRDRRGFVGTKLTKT